MNSTQITSQTAAQTHCQRWAEFLAGHTDEEFTAWTSAATPAWVRTTAEYAAVRRPACERS